MDRASHTEVVQASPQACFDALLDFESYPEWQSAVKACRVLERDEEGRGTIVETTIDAKIKQVRYVLRYHFEPPRRLWWDYVEGDLRNVEGEFVLEDAGDGATRATYEVGVDIGRFAPGPIKKLMAEVTLRGAVRELKARVEPAA